MIRTIRLWILAALALALVIPVGAQAATVVNGDFETGNLGGWQVFNSTDKGNWFVYSGTKTPFEKEGGPIIIEPIEPIRALELEPIELEPIELEKAPPFFAPPQGTWAAVTDEQKPDTAILYQDIALEPYYSHQLTMTLYYRSLAPIEVPTPDRLSVSDGVPPPGAGNQQVRVDVMKPAAPIESLNPADILTTVFANKAGDPKSMAPTALHADLSPFAGQTVRLRIANAVNDNVFNAAVDAVSIASTPPNNVVKKGKLKLNKSNGTAALTVTVPGAGVLKLGDAGGGKAGASKKGKPKLVKPATLKPTAAGRVKVPLKPTGAGKKSLKKKGKLKFKLSLAFTPTGGITAKQTVKGTLRLKLK